MKKIAALSVSFVLVIAISIGGIVPEMQNALGITGTQAELLLTMPSIAILIAALLSSSVSARIGMKKTIGLGLLIVGIAGMMPAFLHSYTPILLSRFFLGLGLGLFNPLAVSIINVLFDEKEVPTLLGFRGSVEFLGQSLLTIIVGLLFQFGWNRSFLVFGAAFVVLAIFLVFVPEVKPAVTDIIDEKPQKDYMNPLVYLIVLFSIVLVICAAAIGIRFPMLAASVMGEGFNASNIMAVQPIFNIVAALVFGKLHNKLGRKLVYIALFGLVVSQLLVGFSNGSLILITIGFFIHGLVPAWIFPFVFNTVMRLSSGKKQNTAVSYIMVGINIGIFTLPFVMQALESIFALVYITDIYPILAVITGLMLVGIVLTSKKTTQLTAAQNY
ncbi:MAG: MFS transporter [Streptococcaceae bacterium]|jgi:MFS family permease|nr:MFS transporter [Streptococcaceae bacterium]